MGTYGLDNSLESAAVTKQNILCVQHTNLKSLC